MPDFEAGSCELFVNSCDKNKTLSTEQILRAVIGVDDNGCPFVKTNGPTSDQVVALTAAIASLTAAINAM